MLDRLSNELNYQEKNAVEDAVLDFNQILNGCVKIRWESSKIKDY